MTLPDPRGAEQIRRQADEVAGRVLRFQLTRWPKLAESMTATQLGHIRQQTRYHVDYLACAVWSGEQVLLDDYVRWMKSLFEQLHLPPQLITGSLSDVNDALAEAVDADVSARAGAYVLGTLSAFDALDTSLPSHLDPSAPHSDLAVHYLTALLGGDRTDAVRAVMDAAESGVPVREIHLHVLRAALLEVGRLWQLNRISVAQEHYAASVTQLTMAQLQPTVSASANDSGTLVAACVGGELHEIGLRMVANSFELDGWDAHFLGANTPSASIVDLTADRNADLVALSANMSFNVPEVGEVIRALRSDSRTRAIPIIVGGYPFSLAPSLRETVGADAYAADPDHAVALASALISHSGP